MVEQHIASVDLVGAGLLDGAGAGGPDVGVVRYGDVDAGVAGAVGAGERACDVTRARHGPALGPRRVAVGARRARAVTTQRRQPQIALARRRIGAEHRAHTFVL